MAETCAVCGKKCWPTDQKGWAAAERASKHIYREAGDRTHPYVSECGTGLHVGSGISTGDMNRKGRKPRRESTNDWRGLLASDDTMGELAW